MLLPAEGAPFFLQELQQGQVAARENPTRYQEKLLAAKGGASSVGNTHPNPWLEQPGVAPSKPTCAQRELDQTPPRPCLTSLPHMYCFLAFAKGAK